MINRPSPGSPAPPPGLRPRWRSLIGLKTLVGAAGLGLCVWTTLHVLGNLALFAGPGELDRYAALLRSSGLVWPARLGLSAALLIHVLGVVVLVRRSRAARPMRYTHRPAGRAAGGWAARGLRWGGVLLLTFTAYHVAHMYGLLGLGPAGFVAGRVQANLVRALTSPPILLLYLGATLLLGVHLLHGIKSVPRTLGLAVPGRTRWMDRAAITWTWFITVGFLVPCVAIALGYGR